MFKKQNGLVQSLIGGLLLIQWLPLTRRLYKPMNILIQIDVGSRGSSLMILNHYSRSFRNTLNLSTSVMIVFYLLEVSIQSRIQVQIVVFYLITMEVLRISLLYAFLGNILPLHLMNSREKYFVLEEAIITQEFQVLLKCNQYILFYLIDFHSP